MIAIESCRTAALGGHVERVRRLRPSARLLQLVPQQNCPKCQGLARAQWLEDRQAELLDVPYFHVVFTVPAADRGHRLPEPDRRLRHPVPGGVGDVAHDRRRSKASGCGDRLPGRAAHLGADPSHHPHVHFLVPGGGIAPDGQSWIACRPGFFLPVTVLSRMFRGLFLHYLEKAFAAGELNFFSAHRHLHEPAAFRRYLAPVWNTECRVGEDVATLTPGHRRRSPAPGSHRTWRADFPHQRSSAVGSQHCKHLQLPVREAQFGCQQRRPFFDLVEGVPGEAAAGPTAAAQHPAPVTLHDPIYFDEAPEIAGNSVISIVAA